MKDKLRQERFESPTKGSKSKMDIEERRSAPRQHFIAEAQVVELKTGAKLIARSCDLVVHGCYVDTLSPFPVGTQVRIRLTKDKATVEASGQVVYGIPGLGMGIAFQNLTPVNKAALDKWLSNISNGQDFFNAMVSPIAIEEPSVAQQQPAGQMVDLILLLIKKGILTSDEAGTLLKQALTG